MLNRHGMRSRDTVTGLPVCWVAGLIPPKITETTIIPYSVAHAGAWEAFPCRSPACDKGPYEIAVTVYIYVSPTGAESLHHPSPARLSASGIRPCLVICCIAR